MCSISLIIVILRSSYNPISRNISSSSDAYLRKIAPMVSTKIAFYIYYLLIISPCIHVYVYNMVFAILLQENYLRNLFQDVPIWEHQALKPLSGAQGTCPTYHTLDTPLYEIIIFRATHSLSFCWVFFVFFFENRHNFTKGD